MDASSLAVTNPVLPRSLDCRACSSVVSSGVAALSGGGVFTGSISVASTGSVGDTGSGLGGRGGGDGECVMGGVECVGGGE